MCTICIFYTYLPSSQTYRLSGQNWAGIVDHIVDKIMTKFITNLTVQTVSQGYNKTSLRSMYVRIIESNYFPLPFGHFAKSFVINGNSGD